MELITNDLILKPVDNNYIEEVRKMWDWEQNIISVDKAREAILYMQENHKKNTHKYIYHLCLAVFEKGCDKIIGWCGLDGKCSPGKTVIFYMIDKNRRNKGYATQCAKKILEYAFETVELKSVYGGCYRENISSYLVQAKAGMLLYELDKEDGGPHFYIDKDIYEKLKILRK